jgi:hypothetical protein
LHHNHGKEMREENLRISRNLFLERRSGPRKQVDQYYNVEFLVDGLDVTHQVKIWNKATKSIFLVVKENSDILPRLKVGETLKMIHCPIHSVYLFVYVEAVVRHITKEDQGQLKDHYLVDLEILKSQAHKKLLRPSRSHMSQALCCNAL